MFHSNMITHSPQMSRQMGLGLAGGAGRHAHRQEGLGQEPVIILHLMVAVHPAWAPLLRLTAVRVTSEE